MCTAGCFDLPLSLLISVKDKSELDYTTRNILNFYNLYDSSVVCGEQFRSQIIERESNKCIINNLNFIRLNTTFINTPQADQNHPQLSVLDEAIVPSYSCILITNNSITATSGKQNNLTQLNRNDWSYNHKVDLINQNGTPIARQLFFRLKNNIPLLFSRSNWTPPHNLRTIIDDNVSTQPNQTVNNTPCKYIIRLNINCINYDSMLYFYRLLFSKCANYSKKDFSLFVLKTSRLENVNLQNTSLITIEYQLSLKYDSNSIVQNSKNATLIYQVSDYEQFNRIIRVLSKYIKELINKKVYSIQDPDRNKIYLVDTSVRFTMPIFSIANSIGISENYFRILQAIQKINLANSPSCSSSSTSSFSFNSNSTAGSSIGDQITPTNGHNHKNLTKFIKSKKKLKNERKTIEIGDTRQFSSQHPSSVVNVKDLISRFSTNENKNVSPCFKSNLGRSKSEYSAYNTSILQNKNTCDVLNIEKLRRKQQVSLLESRPRSHSVLNEPYNKAEPTDDQEIELSSSQSSSLSSLSTYSKRDTVVVSDSCSMLNRNKSVSATNITEHSMNFKTNPNLVNRSKSTVPFNELTSDELDNCYLIADVDEDSYEYVRGGHLKFDAQNRPSVGVTPYTRFRRAPTLDIIRSTRMPVFSDRNSQFVPAINITKPNGYFTNSTDLFLKRQYLSNGELNKNPVAKF